MAAKLTKRKLLTPDIHLDGQVMDGQYEKKGIKSKRQNVISFSNLNAQQ